ncbi:cold-shock protein [Streptomyces sp. NBRC 110035]|nr:hypothetical protein APS67_001835 [Streptomyces sp. AVP053U2]
MASGTVKWLNAARGFGFKAAFGVAPGRKGPTAQDIAPA